MWIRIALDKDSVKGTPNGYLWASGNVEEYYFDQAIANALETDGFLTEMWDKLDALFDWGDCDFFLPEKCILLKEWLENRLSQDVNSTLKPVYETMLDYANKALENDTGISFDF